MQKRLSLPLFTAPEPEPSSLVGFAGNRIERLSENRTEDAAERALEALNARLYLTADGRLLLKFDGSAFDPVFSRQEAQAPDADLANAVLLGTDDGVPVLAVPVRAAPDKLPETVKAIDYRSVYAQGLIPADQLGAMAQGVSLLTWNANHRFCGRCGGETRDVAGGYKRKCTGCGAEHFPRTDPVAIMLAVQDGRCLMGRGAHFPEGMYSCLAGFVEPGETIENAVRREVFEESGIRIGRVAYYASQPWPFPHSLMIGCHAEAISEDISFDGNELQDCRWFTRDEVKRIFEGAHPGGFIVPPSGAIATHLIRAWMEADGE